MWDPLNWFVWIKVIAFISGLLFGAFAIGSTSWVWLRKHLINAFACWLATLGTAMIGMSIWQSVEIEGAGFKAIFTKLEEIAQQQDNFGREIAQLQSQGAQVAGLNEVTGTISNIDLTRATFMVDGKTYTASPTSTVGTKLDELRRGDTVKLEVSTADARSGSRPINVMVLEKVE